jgi:hypothetical protein
MIEKCTKNKKKSRRMKQSEKNILKIINFLKPLEIRKIAAEKIKKLIILTLKIDSKLHQPISIPVCLPFSAARACSDLIWARGLLRKGPGPLPRPGRQWLRLLGPLPGDRRHRPAGPGQGVRLGAHGPRV